MNYKTKIRQSDKLFSQYLREKYPYCQAGGSSGVICSPKLEVSHYHSRGKENTRHDEENCDVFCYNHHHFFHEHKTEFERWKIQQIGKKRFDALMVKAHTYKKRDDKMDILIIKELYKQFCIEKGFTE